MINEYNHMEIYLMANMIDIIICKLCCIKYGCSTVNDTHDINSYDKIIIVNDKSKFFKHFVLVIITNVIIKISKLPLH